MLTFKIYDIQLKKNMKFGAAKSINMYEKAKIPPTLLEL